MKYDSMWTGVRTPIYTE